MYFFDTFSLFFSFISKTFRTIMICSEWRGTIIIFHMRTNHFNNFLIPHLILMKLKNILATLVSLDCSRSHIFEALQFSCNPPPNFSNPLSRWGSAPISHFSFVIQPCAGTPRETSVRFYLPTPCRISTHICPWVCDFLLPGEGVQFEACKLCFCNMLKEH